MRANQWPLGPPWPGMYSGCGNPTAANPTLPQFLHNQLRLPSAVGDQGEAVPATHIPVTFTPVLHCLPGAPAVLSMLQALQARHVVMNIEPPSAATPNALQVHVCPVAAAPEKPRLCHMHSQLILCHMMAKEFSRMTIYSARVHLPFCPAGVRAQGGAEPGRHQAVPGGGGEAAAKD